MCLGHLSNYAVVAQSLLNMGVDDGFVPTKIQDFYVNNEGKLDPNGVLPDFLKLDPNAPEGLVVCLVEFARDEMDYCAQHRYRSTFAGDILGSPLSRRCSFSVWSEIHTVGREFDHQQDTLDAWRADCNACMVEVAQAVQACCRNKQ